MTRITSNKEEKLAYIGEEEKRSKAFYSKHEDFCRYTYMGGTSLDGQLFIRGIPGNSILDEVA
ncbi:MAG: RteC domain-containing protein, partial [Chitinophaga rupis]